MIVDKTPFEKLLAGPDSDVQLRAYYESLRGWLSSERSSWDSQWEQLARYVLPRNQRFVQSDVDRGDRKDYSIVDNTATLALRVLGAGMMSGITSPTREWFQIKTDDVDLNENAEVQDYLEAASDSIRSAFLKSNIYPSLHESYRSLGLYGTETFALMEDDEDHIRAYPYPIGSYYLSGDENLRIDFCMRVVNMTARQIIGRYGRENASSAILSYVDSNAGGLKEIWWPIVYVVHRNSYYGEAGSKFLPWVSVAYEMNSFGTDNKNGKPKILHRGGFMENPIISSRWEVTGENFYGNSPGMDALGDIMGLQLIQKRIAEAIDKMVKPPMVASPALANGKMSLLPGDVTFGDKDAGGFRPAFEMKFEVGAASTYAKEHQRRIESAFYKDLFLMISGSDRREVTAEEIRAKQEEKMLVLGPVLERVNGEKLKPLIKRTFAILRRRGVIPSPPEVMKGKTAVFEFESILAQAQRQLKVASIDRLVAFVGQQAAINPDAPDILDTDEMNREYAEDIGVPSKILRTDDEMAKIREQKQKAQQAAQMAENAQKLAPAAQALSQTDVTGDNALTRLQQTIGQPGQTG